MEKFQKRGFSSGLVFRQGWSFIRGGFSSGCLLFIFIRGGLYQAGLSSGVVFHRNGLSSEMVFHQGLFFIRGGFHQGCSFIRGGLSSGFLNIFFIGLVFH